MDPRILQLAHVVVALAAFGLAYLFRADATAYTLLVGAATYLLGLASPSPVQAAKERVRANSDPPPRP